MKKSELVQMIREELQHVMQEAPSKAAEEAKKKGWVSAGWGRWNDKSGKMVGRTVDGKLVPVKKPAGNVAPTASAKSAPKKSDPGIKTNRDGIEQPWKTKNAVMPLSGWAKEYLSNKEVQSYREHSKHPVAKIIDATQKLIKPVRAKMKELEKAGKNNTSQYDNLMDISMSADDYLHPATFKELGKDDGYAKHFIKHMNTLKKMNLI